MRQLWLCLRDRYIFKYYYISRGACLQSRPFAIVFPSILKLGRICQSISCGHSGAVHTVYLIRTCFSLKPWALAELIHFETAANWFITLAHTHKCSDLWPAGSAIRQNERTAKDVAAFDCSIIVCAHHQLDYWHIRIQFRTQYSYRLKICHPRIGC